MLLLCVIINSQTLKFHSPVSPDPLNARSLRSLGFPKVTPTSTKILDLPAMSSAAVWLCVAGWVFRRGAASGARLQLSVRDGVSGSPSRRTRRTTERRHDRPAPPQTDGARRQVSRPLTYLLTKYSRHLAGFRYWSQESALKQERIRFQADVDLL